MAETTQTPARRRNYGWAGRMPAELREELDRRLRGSDFPGYDGLVRWLHEQGIVISKSAVKRYGRNFEDRLGAIRLATAQARAVCEHFKEDDTTMQNALLRLVQTRLFEVLIAANKRGAGNTAVDLHAVARSVAGLARAEAENRKWRERVAAADKKIDAARADGLSEKGAGEIRRALMGEEP